MKWSRLKKQLVEWKRKLPIYRIELTRRQICSVFSRCSCRATESLFIVLFKCFFVHFPSHRHCHRRNHRRFFLLFLFFLFSSLVCFFRWFFLSKPNYEHNETKIKHKEYEKFFRQLISCHAYQRQSKRKKKTDFCLYVWNEWQRFHSINILEMLHWRFSDQPSATWVARIACRKFMGRLFILLHRYSLHFPTTFSFLRRNTENFKLVSLCNWCTFSLQI